ncbi:MAG: beta-ketoacyl-[acyl-carrier-protein] synthase family protein [Candidatus Methylomirabilales bacterium]
MRRVVVTGMGVVSSIGNNKEEVLRSLCEGLSGIAFIPEMKELGYRCQVAGLVKGFKTQGIGKKPLQTMSDVARYTAAATLEALEDAKVEREALKSRRVGVVLGTGAGGINEAARAETWLLSYKRPGRLGATGVVKMMNSTAALNLAAWLGIKGRCYSVSSACATGADSIGHGFELIRHGLLDLCISGGAEESGIRNFWAFSDAVNASPVDFNDQPEKACRPYDRDRQGMVVSEGAGVLILEALEHAKSRGARVYAEVIGYGSANDGAGVFEPNGQGLKRCIEQALRSAGLNPSRIDYINPHGAGTRLGDPVEVQIIREVFGEPSPLVSSTKGLTGHSHGAAGAHEAIYTLLMLHHGFVAPTANLEQIAPECEGIRHVQSLMETPLETVMTFNAGLGGANACLIFKKF